MCTARKNDFHQSRIKKELIQTGMRTKIEKNVYN